MTKKELLESLNYLLSRAKEEMLKVFREAGYENKIER